MVHYQRISSPPPSRCDFTIERYELLTVSGRSDLTRVRSAQCTHVMSLSAPTDRIVVFRVRTCSIHWQVASAETSGNYRDDADRDFRVIPSGICGSGQPVLVVIFVKHPRDIRTICRLGGGDKECQSNLI